MDIHDEHLDENTHLPPARSDSPIPAQQTNGKAPLTVTSDQLVYDQAAEPSPPRRGSLLGSDPVDVQDRWRDLQTSFVDDPRQAVQNADALLDEVMASVRESLETRIRELQDHWKNVDHNDTEQLRMALRSYRDVLHRLLPLADDAATQ